jgi:serine/threonine-protein kinase RsbW
VDREAALEHQPPDLAWVRPLRSWDVESVAQLPELRAQARAASTASMGQAPVRHPLLPAPERLALVVTELATNALRHAARPVEVAIARSPDGWVVTVSDSRPDVVPQPRPYRPGTVGGRGLVVVAWVTSRMGYFADASRKHVWALVPDRPPRSLLELVTSG